VGAPTGVSGFLKSPPPRKRPECRRKLAKTGSLAIPIAAAIAVFALLWYGSLRAAKVAGVAGVAATAVFLLLTCLATILIGFFLPLTPVLRDFIGSAVFAGSLASAGAIIGMYAADAILARLEARESGEPMPADEKTRRPV
jgi:hypothetical protein